MGRGGQRGRRDGDGELVFGGNGASVWESERSAGWIMVRVAQQYRYARYH